MNTEYIPKEALLERLDEISEVFDGNGYFFNFYPMARTNDVINELATDDPTTELREKIRTLYHDCINDEGFTRWVGLMDYLERRFPFLKEK